MGVIDLSCNMRSVSGMAVGPGVQAKLAIRLVPLPKDIPPGIPPGSTWAWAIVREVKGMQDAMLIGGAAPSMTEACARAELELQSQQARAER